MIALPRGLLLGTARHTYQRQHISIAVLQCAGYHFCPQRFIGPSWIPANRITGSVTMATSNGVSQASPSVSRRVLDTDAPVVVKTKLLMAGVEGVISLAQGVVHWAPPEAALAKAAALLADPSMSSYGPCAGLPALVSALERKVEAENGLTGYDIMVTAGANQAFTNIVLALLDAEDRVVLFTPYYFNHLMAIQMTGGGANVVYGECNKATWKPDLDWLERELAGPHPPKMVVIINPCNPTGVLMTREELERATSLCETAGIWLVMDDTYEHFVYDGQQHHCISSSNVIHIFSFSKAYGMMGWRVGYIAYPKANVQLGLELTKIQDTIPICPTQISQVMALAAVDAGRGWVAEKVRGLEANRQALLDALSPLGSLGEGIALGQGAIYLWAKLPPGCEDDVAVVEWLVKQHRVCVIFGSSCGRPGYIRAAFANMERAQCQMAASRLKTGLQQLVAEGPAALTEAAAVAA